MPDPQNVYILPDFTDGAVVNAALKKAQVSISEPEVDTKLTTKQDKLTVTQQAAVDSGITAEKVSEITNTVTEVQTIVINQIPAGQNLLYATNIAVTLNNTDYKITFQLKDQKGNDLGESTTIDLPIESLVMNVEYDATTDSIIITLQNGTKTSIPVASITSGLQPAITTEHKLSANLVDDSTSSNKFMTTDQATKLAEAVNKVKTQDLENISGLVIESDGTDRIITHTNDVTPASTAAFDKITYDRHGHITGSTPVVTADVTKLVSGNDIKATGYSKPVTTSSINPTDTINEALGKLEAGLDSAGAVDSVDAANNSGLSVDPTTGSVVIDVADGHFIPTDEQWATKVDTTTTINNKELSTDVTLDGTDIALTGYEKPATTDAIDPTDSVNTAIGKLEKAQENTSKTYSNSSAGWAAQPTLISELNAVYIYTDFDSADDRHIPAMKIGDGVTRVVELPFSAANGVTATKIAEWDSKVSAALSASGDTLLLY